MKTEFTFKHSEHKEVTAAPEKVIMNGQSGNIWTFYGFDPLTENNNAHLAKTFMKDRSTKADIVEQFRLMM